MPQPRLTDEQKKANARKCQMLWRMKNMDRVRENQKLWARSHRAKLKAAA